MPNVSSVPQLVQFLNGCKFVTAEYIPEELFRELLVSLKGCGLIDPQTAEQFKNRGLKSPTFIKNTVDLAAKFYAPLKDVFDQGPKQTERSLEPLSQLQRLVLDSDVHGVPILSPGPKLEWTLKMNSEWENGLGRYLLEWTFDLISNPKLMGKIARCGNCGVFFVKTGKRKWCTTECGRRAKAKKYYRKNRSK